jgi:hypothetical protein
MHPELALVDRNFWFRVSTTNVKSHLHERRLFFWDGFNFGNLLAYGELHAMIMYAQNDEVINMLLDGCITRLRT